LKRQGLTQEEIKELMKLNTRSTVARHLKGAGWYEYQHIHGILTELLTGYLLSKPS
jgi:hypothetical protein